MNDFKKIQVVAYYTFREIVKSKILLNTVLLGFFLLIVTLVAYSFTYGSPDRIALDFGVGLLTISSIGIAAFIGVSLLADEIENRTVYMIISRPVKRYVFLLGKLLGLTKILLLNVLILSGMTFSLLALVGGNFTPLMGWTILFIILEAVLFLMVISFLSLVSSKTVSIMVGIAIYVVGHTIPAAKSTGFAVSHKWITIILDTYHFLLPGFYKLNIKNFLIYEESLPLKYLLSTSLYSIFYSLFLALLSIYVFTRKNID